MERRSVRAVLNVNEPPIAFRVLKCERTTGRLHIQNQRSNIKGRRGTLTTFLYIHLGDSIPNTTEFGEFIDALLFDDCAVHIETHSICSPEQFLRLWHWRHLAGRKTKCISEKQSKIAAAVQLDLHPSLNCERLKRTTNWIYGFASSAFSFCFQVFTLFIFFLNKNINTLTPLNSRQTAFSSWMLQTTYFVDVLRHTQLLLHFCPSWDRDPSPVTLLLPSA